MTGVIGAVALLVASVAGDAALTVGVMSFNVRYGTADDGPNHWDKRKEIVADTIRKYDPDIVGTQECLEFQAEYLVQTLPQYRWFGVGREIRCAGEHMAVLYKPKVLAPIESGNFWLSETPEIVGSSSWDSACNRMVTWAKFYHLESKRFFYYFNTHFDHKSEPARQGAAKILRDRIAALPDGSAVVVTGDFNSVAGASETYSILTADLLSDCWETALDKAGPPVTWSAFAGPQLDTNRRIDWILTRGPVTTLRCETVTFNQRGRYPSDHYPVFAKISIGQS